MSKAKQEPDWLADTLQSAVHHARRDRSEETLMRLARDSLLLSEYIRRSESGGGGPPAATAHHRFALEIPGAARHGRGEGASRYKLDSFTQARMTQGTALFPEAFVAGDEDRRLALDAGEGDSVPAPEPGFRMAWKHQAAVAGLLLLGLLMVLAPVI